MEPLTMMVASIGLHFFNNYANNKKNKEIQEKQREFQRAAAEHDFERMRRLQAESAKLALELEAEVHKERVEDINNNYDTLLENFAHSFTVRNWPLSVLPFVMKGESFGSLFNGTTQSVNLHCILTPSNCEWFNANFYDDIDLRLEAEMNSKWNAQSTHPIVYYGGAWNRRTDRTGISVPKNIDLVDIDLIKTSLKNVPVVVITPYFDPWLHFKVRMWGMGEDAGAPFRIDIPHGEEVNGSYQEPAKRIFSFDYHKDKYELTAEFENKTVDEFVPYLECLLGFIADKYFWSMYKVSPQTPSLLSNNLGEPGLQNYKEFYISYAKEQLSKRKVSSFQDVKDSYSYIESVRSLTNESQDEEIQKELLRNIRETYTCSNKNADYPKTYSELSVFLENEKKEYESFSWVGYAQLDKDKFFQCFEERFNLVEYIEKFRDFAESYCDRFDLDNISLYIQHDNYKEFELHVYNLQDKTFLKSVNGFDYVIQTNSPAHYLNKLKYIFRHTTSGSIVCRYLRLDNLIKELKDNEILTF